MRRLDFVASPGFQPWHDGVVHKSDAVVVAVVVVQPIVGVVVDTAGLVQALTTTPKKP